MTNSWRSRIQNAWNAFQHNTDLSVDTGPSYYQKPDRFRLHINNERSIVASIYNRIALDVSCISIQHVQLDENNRFVKTIKSGLNKCLCDRANIDQTGRALIQDVVMSMFGEGVVAIVPVDVVYTSTDNSTFDVDSLRVGKILGWMPSHIKVRLYNECTGLQEDIIIHKDMVAIVENPLFAVINEPNSTMQRLIRKLNILDAIDEQSGSGKMNMIIQLPYAIKSPAQLKRAEQRRQSLESQLTDSRYGIGYADSTEKIIQLNRPLENNLMGQIEYLTSMLYSQLGITQDILNGSANEETMLNYYSRSIEPIVSTIVDAIRIKFLTETVRNQLQSVVSFRDPFKLTPVGHIAEIADKFTRNEILSPNEVRQIIGMKPSDDPKADELKNRNISAPSTEVSNNSDAQEDTKK